MSFCDYVPYIPLTLLFHRLANSCQSPRVVPFLLVPLLNIPSAGQVGWSTVFSERFFMDCFRFPPSGFIGIVVVFSSAISSSVSSTYFMCISPITTLCVHFHVESNHCIPRSHPMLHLLAHTTGRPALSCRALRQEKHSTVFE